MVSSTASVGYGVVAAKGLVPGANNTVVANISGATAFPSNVAIADLAAAMGSPSYQGTWNASTNSPALVSSVGTNGNYYVVSTAGTTNLNGITDWTVGDWAIFNGTAVAWQKIEGGATSITVGSSAIASGTTTRILYDNAGVLGEYPISGTTSVAMTASPTFTGVPSFGITSFITSTISRPASLDGAITASGSNNAGQSIRYVQVYIGAGNTAASPAMTDPFVCNSPLDGSHFNVIATTAVAGVTAVDIYRSSNGPSQGFIGRVLPGASLNDTGQLAGPQAAPTSDYGSAGEVVTGPLTINPSVGATPWGALQVGSVPHIPTTVPAADGFWAKPLITLTADNGVNNTLLFHGIDFSSTIVFRASGTTQERPSALAGGTGVVAFESYVAGSVKAFHTTAHYEGGGSGVAATALSEVYGRHQFGVAAGTSYGYGGGIVRGLGIAAYPTMLSTGNNVAVQTTNLTDFMQYRVGYINIFDVPLVGDAQNWEAAYLGWASGGTTWNVGPMAGSGGTLRPMVLTGANIVVNGSGAAVATDAANGFLYIPTCAGTPTGTPTAFTGRIAMVYDTTNHQFWFYDSGWKQPKTPAAAAIITWQ